MIAKTDNWIHDVLGDQMSIGGSSVRDVRASIVVCEQTCTRKVEACCGVTNSKMVFARGCERQHQMSINTFAVLRILSRFPRLGAMIPSHPSRAADSNSQAV